jgi:predicted nucleotidyltransferase
MDKKIIEIARQYAKKVTRFLPAQMVVLYGSYAKGTAKTSSDIDIAVVVEKTSGDYLKVSAELFELVRGVDKRIEPVLLCRQNDRSGFLAGILKHGVVIYRANTRKAA